MEYTAAAAMCIGIMLFLLIMGIPIAWALGFSSAIVALLTFGASFLSKIGGATFYLVFNLAWTPLPLFVLIGCLIARTAIGEDLFRAARNWLHRLPGGLVVASIFGQAVLAAALGTSSATILAVGKVAVPEFERYKYDKGFSLGALLCGGVLGPVIPPSATMVIYSVLTKVPLGRLFIAGFIPGVILALMLAMTTVIMIRRNPLLGGAKVEAVGWSERFSSLSRIWPIILVGFGILGSIYLGVATPTECGGIGCFLVLVIAVTVFGLRFKGAFEAMRETALLHSMLMIIFIGATLFTYVIGSSELATSLANWVQLLNIPPILVVVIIQIILLILGCFIDGITIMFVTIPIFAYIVQAIGLDLLWFGVLFVVNMEIALITPPMGINLFLVRSVFGVTTRELMRGTMPFLICLIIFLFLLVAFPSLSTWLPGMMRGG